MAPVLTKAQVRTQFKARRDEFSRQSSKVSKAICDWIGAAPEFRAAGQVALFHGRPWEVDLRPLWEAHRQKCFYPRSAADSVELRFYKIEHWQDLQPGYAGIFEPPANPASLAAPWRPGDLVLVPGTTFDGQGGRVGSGKGFYDRFLAENPALFWGVCLSLQLADSALAQDPTDVRMVALCTERGIQRIE